MLVLGQGLGRKVMDGGEGWCTIKYAGGAHDKTIINRIMLRYRPIIPKPTTGGFFSGESALDKKNVIVSPRRTKRKYVRVRRNSNGCNKGKGSEETKQPSTMTLQLLPMNCTEENDASDGVSWGNVFDRTAVVKQDQEDENSLIRLDLMSSNTGLTVDARPLYLTALIPAVKTWVTVEYVSDTCMDTRGLGCTDFERITNLEGDTCPAFISDGLNRVLWVNEAFRAMVKANAEVLGESPEMEVWLVVKERLLPCMVALTSHVKVEFRWWKKWRRMVPCDAWRMDGGGYAWRLDVKAALSLDR